jgi:hypothetical protein
VEYRYDIHVLINTVMYTGAYLTAYLSNTAVQPKDDKRSKVLGEHSDAHLQVP